MTSFLKQITSSFSSIISPEQNIEINNYKEANYYNYYRVLEQRQPNEIFGRNSFGLLKKGERGFPNTFKLNEFSIDSTITDSCILSLWKQSYENDSDTPIEATYSIPLSPLQTVSSFVVEYQDKVLIGKIKEKSKANEIYSDALASGGQAFIAEKSSIGYFNFIIGNLPPKTNVTINITMISEVGTHLSSIHYCLHRLMFPLSKFNFNLNTTIELTTPIKSVYLDYTGNNGNQTITQLTNNKYNVKFSTISGVLSNIVMVIDQNDQDKPQALIEYNKNENTYGLTLNFFPKFESLSIDQINQKSEFIFLIDCSGSMDGIPIKRAKRALEIIIRSLNEQHKLNIYCFGSNFTKAFPTSVHYNDETLKQLDKYISLISANLGGTELLYPIKDVLRSKYDPEYPRQLFILTDGCVSERDQLIDYVSKESGTTRIFTYGIGSGVDVELVVGLSKVCGGYYELIKDNSNMEVQVMKLLSIAFKPAISNITFDWGKLEYYCKVIQAPAITRPIFYNERMITYALIEEVYSKSPLSTIDGTITITMNCNGPTGSKLSYPIDLDFKNVIEDGSNSVHTLAAFKHIQDLEEIERIRYQPQKDKIVNLGKKFNIVSKHTSFIVTFDSDEPTFESMKSVDIIKSIKESYSSTVPTTQTPINHQFRSVSYTRNPTSYNSIPRSIILSSPQLQQQNGCCDGGGSYYTPSTPPPRYSSNTPPILTNDPLINLLKLQKANGSFIKSTIVNEFEIVEDKIPKEFQSDHDIWVTLLVIAYIFKTFSNQKPQFELTLQKSSKWVKQQLFKLNIDSNSFDSYLKLAKSII